MIQNAWKKEQRPLVHGWVYALDDGLLKQLVTLGPDTLVDPIYRWND
jgi:carbonic anhydrase